MSVTRGYATLHRTWQSGDVVDVTMDMPVRRMKSHPQVAANAGRVALMRGPLVYAVETIGEDFRAGDVFLPPEATLMAQYRPDLLGGICVIPGDLRARAADPSPNPVSSMSRRFPTTATATAATATCACGFPRETPAAMDSSRARAGGYTTRGASAARRRGDEERAKLLNIRQSATRFKATP